jgi:Phage capsid family
MGPIPDFSGYVTKYGIKCSDGRTILKHAFQADDGTTIPLVWQHQHDAPENVLGHMVLKHHDDGVRADAFFNDTPPAQQAKALVIHKDIVALSIYANKLVQRGMEVLHGAIKEGSLVLSGANPGAFIDFINLVHGDEVVESEEEAVIYSGEPLELGQAAADAQAKVIPQSAAKPDLPALTHAADLAAAAPATQTTSSSAAPSVADVIASMTEQQREVVYALIGQAMQQSDTPSDQTGTITSSTDDQKGDQVSRNVFDQTSDGGTAPGGNAPAGTTLTHSDLASIFDDARRNGSLKNAVEDYALAHGITNIDLMFPDAKALTDTPDWQSRRQEWVQGVLSGTRHTPFARIKTMLADITLDEARARGYVKGAMKREEWFAVSKRVTTPQTVYKKQKLDRDDIVDITDFDVVTWLKGEMRLMLDEEVARAILVGDGRDVADPDKINETNVRPILTDSDVYVTTVNVVAGDFDALGEDGIVDRVATAMQFYLGTGQPTMYAPRSWITKMLLAKDTLGRRFHATLTELADAMGIGSVVPVDAMESYKDTVIAIIVNLSDYTVGTDRGGEVNFFDDFDIDYNKYTYLYETRLSGALVKFKSALVVKIFTGAGGILNDPTTPTFVKATGVVTIPTMANVTYVSVNDTTGAESANLTAGAQAAIAQGAQIHIRAKPAATFAFANNAVSNWTFQRPAA